jgi:predicted adenylyl cyclase CyaB
MPNETEIKVRLASDEQVSSVLALCRTLYRGGSETLQRDEYYDTVGEKLKEQDLTLRLRSADGTLKVALKSPRIFLSETIHQRIELEFSTDDETQLRQQLKRQNLSATAVIEKRRWTFKSDKAEIVIDKLPFIGAFVEVEGVDLASIEAILESLHLSSVHAVRQNYSELLEAKVLELRLPIRPNLRATFEAERQWMQEQGKKA